MMEDNAALNRRSNPPTRIVTERPQRQATQILWETVTSQGKTNEPLQEQQITSTIKEYAEQRRKMKNSIIKQLRKRTKEAPRQRSTNKNRG